MSTIVLEETKKHFNSGNNYFKQREFTSAILEYQKALKIYPKFTDAYNKLGTIYILLGKFELARNEYLKIIEIEPENSKLCYSAHNALGEIYSKLGDYKNAINEFKKAAACIKQWAYKNVKLTISKSKNRPTVTVTCVIELLGLLGCLR